LIKDAEGVQFLQRCLPRLHLRWQGFRKVRRQVYKRMNRRLQDLGFPDIAGYENYLESHPAEWRSLESLCWISISRFYRDRRVFQILEADILPQLAQQAKSGHKQELRCWSAGCAAGEEPYTLRIIWKERLASHYSAPGFSVTGTDIDRHAIKRAQRACYPASSLKELPADWRARAFTAAADEFCLNEEYRRTVTFAVQDIRERAPGGHFHLILCRNLVFTYFDERLQAEILARLKTSLVQGGALIIGKLESLPEGASGFESWSARSGVYRRR
jgi:chemotaxis protein methyltransferase CheR